MDVRVGLWRKLSAEELMLLNYGIGEASWNQVPWTARRSKQSILKEIGNIQPWIFIGRTEAKAEAPILWPPDVKNWLIRKDPNAGKDWRQEEKRTTKDKMVGWHHWLNGHEFEQDGASGKWWRTGKPGVLQSIGSQRVGHDWVTGQQLEDQRGLSKP